MSNLTPRKAGSSPRGSPGKEAPEQGERKMEGGSIVLESESVPLLCLLLSSPLGWLCPLFLGFCTLGEGVWWPRPLPRGFPCLADLHPSQQSRELEASGTPVS